MSAKGCSHHHGHSYWHWKKRYRYIFFGALSFIILVLLAIFIIWLVLRPSKPSFYLQDASIAQFNFTAGTNLLTAIMQVTVSSRNPNDRIGIYYDKLDVFAVYQEQRVTTSTELPTGYQGHNDVVVWSPYLYGAAVPVTPYLSVALDQANAAGLLLVNINVEGRLRWKVGTWTSGHYHIHVSCPAFMGIDHGSGSNGDAPSFHFQHATWCSVDV
ncbi:NDR1/HIN1-like protein 1 [Musa acuminata AAA Group]|uniref:NDR1/HIN1-like protein 1 n=1 Tax=Musa acuminata AAA Group TaxID=214697 RepID=UPI0031E40D72